VRHFWLNFIILLMIISYKIMGIMGKWETRNYNLI
jgi:hypothetical protein